MRESDQKKLSFSSETSARFTEFFDTDRSSPLTPGLSHSTHSMRILFERFTRATRWVFKEFSNETFAASEVISAQLCRAILPKNTPRMLLINDDNKDEIEIVESMFTTQAQFTDATRIDFSQRVRGTASKLYEVFITLQDFLDGKLSEGKRQYLLQCGVPECFIETLKTSSLEQKVQWLAEYGFIEVCAASAILQDDDIHKENIAITFDTKTHIFHVVRIDFDMAPYPFLSKKGRKRQNLEDTRELSTALRLTKNEISQFMQPFAQADFYYWPTTYRRLSASHGYTSSETVAFAALAQRPDANSRAYAVFLRTILLPEAFLTAVIQDTDFKGYHAIETSLLRATLLSCKEFTDWLSALTKESVIDILSEFDTYNSMLSPEEQTTLSIDLCAVENQLNTLRRDTCLPKLTQLLDSITYHIQRPTDDQKKQQLLLIRAEIVCALIPFTQAHEITSTTNQHFIETLTEIQTRITSIVPQKARRVTETLQSCIDHLSGAGKPSDLCVMQDTLRQLPPKANNILINQVNAWISQLCEGHTLAHLFDEAFNNYEKSFSRLTQFFTRPISKSLFTTQIKRLKNATSAGEVKAILINLFTHENSQPISHEFAKMILAHCMRLFPSQLYSRYLCQSSTETPILWNDQTESLICQETTDLFVHQWAHARQVTDAADGWALVGC